MTTYSVYLADPFGVRLADASRFVELKYSLVTNSISRATLKLPGDFDTTLIRIPDGRLEIWRRLESGREYLDGDKTWLIKKITQRRDDAGNISTELEAHSPLCLLREPGRFVNYYAGSAQAEYPAAPADNQIKQVVRENLGSAALASRDLSAYLSVAANLSQGANIAKAFAWRDVLAVCQEFAEASTQAGIYIAFDMIAPTPDSYQFVTYAGQRGVDHRFPNGQNPVVLSPSMGNLGSTELTIDYADEVTYVLCGGSGEGAARVTGTAEDGARQGASPFGRREKFVEQTSSDDVTMLNVESSTELRAGRARVLFSGKVIETSDTKYGVHWGWGDYVTAQDFGRAFDCRIDAVTVTVSGGGEYETIEAWLRAEL